MCVFQKLFKGIWAPFHSSHYPASAQKQKHPNKHENALDLLQILVFCMCNMFRIFEADFQNIPANQNIGKSCWICLNNVNIHIFPEVGIHRINSFSRIWQILPLFPLWKLFAILLIRKLPLSVREVSSYDFVYESSLPVFWLGNTFNNFAFWLFEASI